jgi:hypothetical protein
MDEALKKQIVQWDGLSTNALYGLLPSDELGLGEGDPDARIGAGKNIFIKVLPRFRDHLCGTPLYRKLLTERPHRTGVEIAVLLTELLPGTTLMGVPCGPVLLIIVREMFETLCE